MWAKNILYQSKSIKFETDTIIEVRRYMTVYKMAHRDVTYESMKMSADIKIEYNL